MRTKEKEGQDVGWVALLYSIVTLAELMAIVAAYNFLAVSVARISNK